MKKLIYIPAAAGILAFGGIVLADGGTSQNAEKPQVETAGEAALEVEMQRFISVEEAGKIAQTKAQGESVELKLNGDDDNPHYSVEVKKTQTVQQFEIDAVNGSIRQTESELAAVNKHEQQNPQTIFKKQLIGKEQAVEIARTVATGKLDDVELEKEHGMFIYEVEFEDGDTDYEVQVDAINGIVLHVETDHDD
ncbi:PepSY domain-containing protein [Planococcus sp. ISL-109]|uniref:PepSY domain-containing protein n=1 Tax=Planococcus sp. ISL-109 TaxID=2819166 RepID=UPI001BE7E4F5|nr:PepSY domain-containing protein [Planococcus sp. ISL-109]MBT2581768.1 PepSY domain-containing protein [Planococcus sp. ISL-109]